jgi:hypothetical protein
MMVVMMAESSVVCLDEMMAVVMVGVMVEKLVAMMVAVWVWWKVVV